MAKRLSKALRDKRRWVGLNVSNCEDRAELESKIAELAPVEDWKLYDFSNGSAILRILHKHEKEWRKNPQSTGFGDSFCHHVWKNTIGQRKTQIIVHMIIL